jgi:hypothetical protein
MQRQASKPNCVAINSFRSAGIRPPSVACLECGFVENNHEFIESTAMKLSLKIFSLAVAFATSGTSFAQANQPAASTGSTQTEQSDAAFNTPVADSIAPLITAQFSKRKTELQANQSSPIGARRKVTRSSYSPSIQAYGD